MTSSVTIPVEFATSHAMFEVRGVPSSGGTDTDRVIVAATQTGFLELRIN